MSAPIPRRPTAPRTAAWRDPPPRRRACARSSDPRAPCAEVPEAPAGDLVDVLAHALELATVDLGCGAHEAAAFLASALHKLAATPQPTLH